MTGGVRRAMLRFWKVVSAQILERGPVTMHRMQGAVAACLWLGLAASSGPPPARHDESSR
jgi:hypothetical protein